MNLLKHQDFGKHRVTPRFLWRRGLTRVLPIVLSIAFLGCLGEPEIDERWTLLQITESNPAPTASRSGSQPINIAVNTRVTYRRILTGFVVAEARYSPTIAPNSLMLRTDQHTEEVAQNVDYILANSVTTGRATRIVTGWDHLMQTINMSFTANVPAQMFPGGTGPAVGGMFVVLYMGSGDEIELEDGTDSLVVTPFPSGPFEILYSGFPLNVTAP